MLASSLAAQQQVNLVGKFSKQVLSTINSSHTLHGFIIIVIIIITVIIIISCQVPVFDFRVRRSFPHGLQITLHPDLRHFSSDTQPDFHSGLPNTVTPFLQTNYPQH